MTYNVALGEFKDFWEEDVVVILDTNAILDLYRYSSNTTDHIFALLEEVNEQIWIPHQVVVEFERNYRSVISNARKKYSDVTQNVQTIFQKAKNGIDQQFIRYRNFNFPRINELDEFITSKIAEIESEASNFSTTVDEEIRSNQQMLEDGRVKAFVDSLNEAGRVGAPSSFTEKISIYAEGATRYHHKLPPGYMDIDKDKKDDTKTEKFGDLILWKQLLKYAHCVNKSIIFITNDDKEDWWVHDIKKSPIAPRPELLEEFRDYSDKHFMMMSLSNFVSNLSRARNMDNQFSYIEMNADDFAFNLINEAGWDILINKSGLTSYLIHSGDLQDRLGYILSDVEIERFGEPEINIDDFDVTENSVTMEGTFKIPQGLEILIYEGISADHEEQRAANLKVFGYVNFSFKTDLQNNLDFDTEDDFISSIKDSLRIEIGGFEIEELHEYYEYDVEEGTGCIECGEQNASYETENGDPLCEDCSAKYMACPECGLFFEELPGAFCDSCERNHD